ncbi:HET-domain-containing protein [Lentinus brumalis]|uniref:HET-domain-containing protein n=1 Tax=Lentinus brumalis TaxID=2498619 RepID=A0A371CKH3_9APHY|nr:HET-domain-containing protein [Polyporus brumalis]
MDGSWGPGFRHHENIYALTYSSLSCALCSLILDVVKPLLDKVTGITQGWLGLYPWSSRLGEQTGTSFITVFSEGVRYTYWGGFLLGKIPPHVLNICFQQPWTREGAFPPHSPQSHLIGGAPGVFRHIPSTAEDSAAFDTARAWMRECMDHHGDTCQRGGVGPLVLPGMLIDLGPHATSMPRLCVPPMSPITSFSYAALTHCWGGEVPGQTLLENVGARRQVLDVFELPANFRDAIRITRELGIRYLWIDALCIIQDSDEDWRAEAAKMAAIYSGAAVVVSAMDSNSSAAGILKPDRISSVRLNEKHIVQRGLPLFQHEVASCPLNQRGWCMQERLLAPAILHYGAQQLFWECRAYHAYEDGRLSLQGGTLDGEAGKFITLRQNILQSPTDGWRVWYRLVEEYSSRALTRLSDKLPALAGAAAIFRTARGEGTYVAGLWREDIVQGIVWGAHYRHYPSRKVPGYMLTDACAVLTRPPTRRAPSWSWASVDGPVIFGWTVHSSFCEFQVLDVTMRAGWNDYMQPAPAGSLKLRAQVAEAQYVPVEEYRDGGALIFQVGGHGDDEGIRLTACVMDFDRKVARACWAMSITPPSTNATWVLLVLHKREDGCFERIGLCVSWQASPVPDKHSLARERFVAQDITLI